MAPMSCGKRKEKPGTAQIPWPSLRKAEELRKSGKYEVRIHTQVSIEKRSAGFRAAAMLKK